MSLGANSYLFDTSAILSLLRQEEGVETVEDIISNSKRNHSLLYISFVTLTEVHYVLLRHGDKEKARQAIALIKELPLAIIYPDETLSLSAGVIKSSYRLSLADAYIAALALDKKATLVHKDPEFDSLDDLIEMKKLPFKKNEANGRK